MPTESVKLIKIGEAAKLLGVSVRTLRYWEEKGFLTAVKTPGGTRMYRQADLLGFDKFNLISEKINPVHENSIDNNFSQPEASQTTDLTDDKLPNKNFNSLEARDLVGSTNPTDQWEDTFSEEPLTFQAGEAVISSEYVSKKARFGLSHPRYKSAGIVVLFMTVGILTWWGLNSSNMFRDDQSISLLERFVAPDAQTQNSASNSFSKKIIAADNNAAVLAAVNPNFVLTVNVDTDIQAALSAQSMTLTDPSNQLGLGSGLTISGAIQNNNVIASIPTLSGDSEFLFTDQTQTLSNKTISGNTNTITNIPNSALSNASITINTSGTLSGGGIVSLGGSITLTGASSSSESSGVSSITGTAGQVIASGSTGAVTLSLPQSIAPSSTVQFGNIGIGTTQANEALDVNGRLYIYDTTAPSTTTNRLYSVGGVLYWDGADISGGAVQYWTRSIGILSPATSSDGLSVTGGATLTGTLNFNDTGTSSTAIGNSSGTVTIASGGTTSWTNTAGNLTVSTSTSGTLAISSAGALNLTGASASYFSIPTNTAGAFKIWDGTNNLISFDTRTTTSGVAATTLTGIAPTIASASTSEYTTLNVSPPTITLTGGTNVTSAMDSVLINQPTITDASAVTINEANTFTVAGAPIPAGSATITRAVGLRVAAGAVASGATNAYGLFVDAPTSGSANYSAVFNSGNVGIGTTTPGSLLQVGGAMRLGVASSTTGSLIYQNSSNANTTTIQSGAPGSSFTLTLPTSSGSNGDCLQTNGAGGVLSFAACTGGAGGGVTSLDGLSGVLTLANSTGSGATVTIDNAAADGATKGIAAFNSTNFSASSGVINTIQGISTAASPSFTGLSLTGLSSSTGSGLCVSGGVVYTCSSGSSAGTLQSDYDNGNTIATSTGKDIAFTLSSGLASPTQFSLTQNHTSGTNAFYLNNANASGTNTNGILVEQTGAGTLTNGINITRTAGTLTNGLTFTGTFTNLINSTNFSVSNAGAVTAVGVNSGSGLLQGTGGITLTGTANINATGTSLTNIGNSTGVLTIASGGSSGWTNTSGTLTLSTASSGAINLTSAHTAGQTTTAAFNIKTSTNLGASDEVLQIGDSAADFLTVLGNGFVGIGTSNPTKDLVVNTTTNDGGLIIRNGSASHDIFRFARDGSQDRGEMFILNADTVYTAFRPTSASYFNGSGNFGIGTTAPGAKLTVVGPGTTTGINFQTQNSSYTPLLTGLDNGNIGIGTTVPTRPLEIYNALPMIEFSRSANYEYSIGIDNGTYAGLSDFIIRDDSAAATRFVIEATSGNIGIGTTNPLNTVDFYKAAGSNLTMALRDGDVANPFTGFTNPVTTDAFGGIATANSTAGGLTIDGYSDTDATGQIFRGFIGAADPTDTTPATVFRAYKFDGVDNATTLASAETAFQFQNGSTPIVTMLGGGNVGIGDTTPANMFTVGSSDAFQINSSGNIVNIGGAAHNVSNSSGALVIDSASTGAIGIGTAANAKTITLGNATGATALAFNSGTGAQTFTSRVVSGTTTTSAFVFDGAALTSGTGLYTTSATLTTGKLAQFSTGSSNLFSSGTLVDMRTTSTGLTGTAGIGSLLNLDWSPGSATTATGDLFSLNIGTNGTTTGNLFNILDTGSSIFSISETALTSSLPANFTAPGDVSIAYDINFTNPTASYVKSAAPLYIASGETFNSSDLTLQTYNSGNIVLQTSTSGNTVVPSGNVGIGTTLPASGFEISSDTNQGRIYSTVYTNSTSGGFVGRRASGTAASPGVLNSGDLITFFAGRSWDGTAFATGSTAYMAIWAGETWSSTNQGSYMTFVTTPTGSTTSAERMRIAADGNVGIGTSDTTTYKLRLNGQPAANGYTAFTNYSDSRLKENITYMGSDILDKLNQLQPAQFNYNAASGYDEETRSRTITGLIAQNVLSVFPEMVGTTRINGSDYYDTNLGSLQIYLLQGIKELSANTAATYKLNSEGVLEIPELKVGKLILDPNLDLSGTANNQGTLSFAVMSLEDRVTALEQLAGDSQLIANSQTIDQINLLSSQVAGIATSSSELANEISEVSLKTDSLEASIASTSDTISQLQTLIDSFIGNPAEATPSGETLASPDFLMASGSATLANLNVTEKASTLLLDAQDATVAATLKSLGETYLGNTTVAGSFSQDGTFSIANGNTINALPILYLQNSIFAEKVDLFNGIVTIDKNGVLAVEKLVIGDKSLGTVMIPAGSNSVQVTNADLTTKSKVFTSTNQAVSVGVSNKNDLTDEFTLVIPSPMLTDLYIDWWIVDGK